MKIPWAAVAHIGVAILGTVVPGVSTIEQIATRFGQLRGKDKQDAVALLVQNALLSTQAIAGKQLADNTRVDAATRAVIDAVVKLHEVIAVESAAAAV